MATLTAGAIPLDFGQLNLSRILTGAVALSSATTIRLTYPDGSTDELSGAFSYDGNGALVAGTLARAVETLNGQLVFDVSGFAVPVPTFTALAQLGDNTGLLALVFGGADTLTGSSGADVLRGYDGDDRFVASAGADRIDGGGGINTLKLSGTFLSYIVSGGGGAWSVIDGRANAPDGRQTTTAVQRLEFFDSTLTAANTPTAATVRAVEAAFANQGRADPIGVAAQTATLTLPDGSTVANPLYAQRAGLLDVAARVDAGGLTLAAAVAQIGHYFDGSTAVATLAYQFFTGKTPSAAGYDFLVSSPTNPNDLNDPYYAKFTPENRYINFAVNLGKIGEGAAAFNARYGGLTLSDAVKAAYLEVFGFAADDAKVAAILTAPTGLPGVATRADYFAAYGGDGANGIGTKAAMVGFLMVEAVKADLGTYAQANDRFMAALGAGTAQFNIDLKAVYGVGLAPAADGHESAPLIGVHGDGAAW